MKCPGCLYKKVREVLDVEAYDTEHRRFHTIEIDYCEEHSMPCDDAYLQCPYREITVEAQHIQHVIHLIESLKNNSDACLAIDYLNKILKGEDLE
jgi:hypothetical protein